MNNNTIIIFLFFIISIPFSFSQSESNDQLNSIIGDWSLDLTPENKTDNVSAIMHIESVENHVINGFFYSEYSSIQSSSINTQTGKIHVSFVTNDNSGVYNTTFYIEDDKLYGTTHSVGRNFLSVWVGEKSK